VALRVAHGNIETALADYKTYVSLASAGSERAEIEEKIKSLEC